MSKPTDVRVVGVRLYFLPVQTRVPLKFGTETLTSVTCARVAVRVADRAGRTAVGWGETPLSVQWVWPSASSYAARHEALCRLTENVARRWVEFGQAGHPVELGLDFQRDVLPASLAEANAVPGRDADPVPWLAGLVCCSAFDLAVHDAYGVLLNRPVYALYGSEHMNRDLGELLEPAGVGGIGFCGHWIADYLEPRPPTRLRAWHLVGGLDPIGAGELTGREPNDGYPVLLRDWVRRDGLKCLKVKLRGTDAGWDYVRLAEVGRLGVEEGVEWLTADFNCTVTEPGYVTEILDRLCREQPRLYGMLLYVEQPFPYELEQHRIDVHAVAARKPLFLDESAHDWRMVRLGRELGWSGVALKTCKTQTGALLSACWAKAHGMTLMVQDLTNPMLAQVPHVMLAAHVGTIMGVETNAMQFYPDVSGPEAAVHPGLYRRRGGEVDLVTISGPGFGLRVDEIRRELPPAAVVAGDWEAVDWRGAGSSSS